MNKPAQTIRVVTQPATKRYSEVYNIFAYWGAGKRSRRLLVRWANCPDANKAAAKIALALGLSLYINNKGTKIAV